MARPKTVTAGLSQQALVLLAQLFSKNSNLSVPAGVADAVVEIRDWATEQQKGSGNVLPFAPTAVE